MRKIKLFILFSLFAVVAFALDFAEFTDRQYSDLVRGQIGTSAFKTYVHEGYKFAVFSENGETKYFLLSTDYAPVKGYKGTTTVGIVLNSDMSVNRATIIRSQDTNSYIRQINSRGFMRRFAGYKTGDKVELISGATMTCRAIKQSIDESMVVFGGFIKDDE